MMLWSERRARITSSAGAAGTCCSAARARICWSAALDNDTFLIRHGTGVDTIADLQAGDRIDIRDFNFASFQAVLDAAHQAHGDVVINLGGDDQLVIEDAKLSDLHAEQFIISSQI